MDFSVKAAASTVGLFIAVGLFMWFLVWQPLVIFYILLGVIGIAVLAVGYCIYLILKGVFNE